MKRLAGVLVVGVLVLGSCGTLRKVDEIATEVSVLSRVVGGTVRQADVDQNGTITRSELTQWLAGGGIASLLGLFEWLRRRLKRKTAQLWARKADKPA